MESCHSASEHTLNQHRTRGETKALHSFPLHFVINPPKSMNCVFFYVNLKTNFRCVRTEKLSLNLNKQRGIIALDRQGTQQQRLESPRVTPPGVRVNTRYLNSTKDTSPKKDVPSGIYTLHFRHTRRHRCVQAYNRINFYSVSSNRKKREKSKLNNQSASLV